MELGIVGLGRMGANMARRLMRDGHRIVAYDVTPTRSRRSRRDGAEGAASLAELAAKLAAPRSVWVMVPAGEITEKTSRTSPRCSRPGDAIVDGGNSYYRDDIRRAEKLREKGIDFIDCGTSGGVFGLERGYCLMIGGPDEAVERLDPIFATLAPGSTRPSARRAARASPAAENGYLHCGPERRRPLREDGPQRDRVRADGRLRRGPQHPQERQRRQGRARGRRRDRAARPARVLPVRPRPARGRRGLAARQRDRLLAARPDRRGDAGIARPRDFAGRVSDSGEGRWTSIAAIDEGVPAPVLTTALYERFSSRDLDDFGDKVLSAMRKQFGGHDEKTS